MTVDLAGGRYRVSAPVELPAGYANMNMQRGSIVAAPDFDGSFVLHVGAGYCNASGALACTGLVGLQQLVLDGNNTADGALLLDNVEFSDVEAVLLTGFTQTGALVNGSGGVYLHHSWVGQHSVFEVPRDTAVTSTGIVLAATEHDSIVQDVVVFSARTGIEALGGSSTLFDGVHVWNLMGSKGGVGIAATARTRIVSCYFDYTPLLLVNPIGVSVVGSFFYQTANIVLRSTYTSTNAPLYLLLVTDNWFFATNTSIEVQDEGFPFTSLAESVVENNMAAQSMTKVGTRATLTANVHGTEARLDFSAYLALPGIDIAEARCTLLGAAPVAMATEIAGQTVTVRVASSVTAQVLCDVDQSTRWHPAH